MTYVDGSLARIRLFLEFVAVFCVVIIPVFVHAGVVPSPFTASETNATDNRYWSSQAREDTNVLQRAEASSRSAEAQGGGSVFVTEGALVATGPAGEDEIATTRVTNGEISVYTVRPGDSLSQIAEMYSVTANTILWANDISSATSIQPGDTLIILPIAGVQHTISSGDTLAAIARKYDGDEEEIMAYNQLRGTDDLAVGDVVVVPGGRIENKPAPATKSRVATTPQPVQQSGSVSTSGGFTHPLPGSVRTQGIHGYNAVDFGAAPGTTIRAAAAGEVIVSRNSGWNGGYGNYIVIRHPNGVQTLYAHNSRNVVGVGAYVQAGETIGYVGSTGRSTGPHLHFEVRGGTNPF